MARTGRSALTVLAALITLTGAGGCGGEAAFFNPAFVNALSGGVFPTTPGPTAGFVLVRVVNETNERVDFIVTVEKEVPKTDENGVFILDDSGDFVLEAAPPETVTLPTSPAGRARDIGVLFPCRQQRLARIGLGENLQPGDAAALVGGAGTAAAPGTRITVGSLNPLSYADNNFDCGDTVIFRAYPRIGVPGNVALESFLLPGSEQPGAVTGPDTFVAYEEFLESQVREDE